MITLNRVPRLPLNFLTGFKGSISQCYRADQEGQGWDIKPPSSIYWQRSDGGGRTPYLASPALLCIKRNNMVVFSASLVSSTSELREFLASVPPHCTLYLDLEREDTRREGSISLITILVHPLHEVHIIDVLSLGYRAFTTTCETGADLASLLGDAGVTKCVWDVSNTAHALWADYEISIAGAMDIQLLENASRRAGHDKAFLCERDRAIRYDLQHHHHHHHHNHGGSKWMPLPGGPRDSAARPLQSDTLLDCTRGVLHLQALRDVYMRRISIAWLAKVRDESAHRVALARDAGEYEPRSLHAAANKGPWTARLGAAASTAVSGRADEKGLIRVTTLELGAREVEKKRSRLLRLKDSLSACRHTGIQTGACDDWWD